jgi:glyoxylase-like metal-dependent hydrolase (beta-lactamase superfamily II)
VTITPIAQPGRLGQPWVRAIVPGVFRVGTTFLGCYAIEDAGAYTFIDVGLPGYWPQMTRFLAARHAPLSSVKAVVLTHFHPDHMGNAERLRTQAGTAVLVHHDDRAAAMRKGRPALVPAVEAAGAAPGPGLAGKDRAGQGSLGPAQSRSPLGGKSAAGRQAGPADRGPDKLKGLPGEILI